MFAAQEAPYIVAKAAVPFLPTISNEAAHLIKSGSIPSLGNYLCAGEHWIRLDIPKHRRIGHHVAVGIACKNRCEIETETIHVHFLDPIAEAIQHQAADNGMGGIESVSCSAVVSVTRPLMLQNVVGTIVESAE